MEYIRNKKAFFNYEIQEEFEAGIELLGLEARSIRANQGNIDSSYIIVRGGEAFLVGADIPSNYPSLLILASNDIGGYLPNLS